MGIRSKETRERGKDKKYVKIKGRMHINRPALWGRKDAEYLDEMPTEDKPKAPSAKKKAAKKKAAKKKAAKKPAAK